MTAPFQLRRGASGPLVEGTPGFLLAIAADGRTIDLVAPGAGGGGRVFTNTLFVDGNFVGTSTGSLDAPYADPNDALAVVPPGVPTALVLAPMTYGDVVIPHGLNVALCVMYWGGNPNATVGNITWNLDDFDQLYIAGVNFSTVHQVDHDAGTAECLLTLLSVSMGDGTSAVTGTTAHAVTMEAYGGALFSGQPSLVINGDVTVSDTIELNNVLCNRALNAVELFADNTAFIGNFTHGVSFTVLQLCEFSGGPAIFTGSVAMDEQTAQQAGGGAFEISGGGTILLNSLFNLGPRDVTAEGGTENLDFLAPNVGRFQLVTIGADTTFTTTDPLVPMCVVIRFLYSAAGTPILPATFKFPGGVTPAWTKVAGKWDELACHWDGATYTVSYGLGYGP